MRYKNNKIFYFPIDEIIEKKYNTFDYESLVRCCTASVLQENYEMGGSFHTTHLLFYLCGACSGYE